MARVRWITEQKHFQTFHRASAGTALELHEELIDRLEKASSAAGRWKHPG